jgi:glycosyltransferase involved in cell wall biosynthesis
MLMISIVIPTLNEEEYLPKLLESIKKQDYKDYEIIVADAKSKDKTRKIAKKDGCRIVTGGMPAVGRNNGAADAKGEYILFLDSDVVLPKNFLKRLMKEFEKRFLDIATCNFKLMSRKKIDRFLGSAGSEMFKLLQYVRPQAPGWCLLVTKRLHNRIKGFDESLFLSEDLDYCVRAVKFGRFGIIDKLNVYVSPRRLEKEGRLNYLTKCLYTQGYRAVNGKIKKKIVSYDFGKFEGIKKRDLKNILNIRIKSLRNQFKEMMRFRAT